MKTFKDSQGNEWAIRLTCGDCERESAAKILESHGCGSLWNPSENFYAELMSNAKLAYDLIVFLSRGDSKGDLVELDENTFPQAASALWGVVSDFFQSTPTTLLGWRPALEALDVEENGKSSTASTQSVDALGELTGAPAPSAS